MLGGFKYFAFLLPFLAYVRFFYARAYKTQIVSFDRNVQTCQGLIPSSLRFITFGLGRR